MDKFLKGYYLLTVVCILLGTQNLIRLPTGIMELVLILYFVLASRENTWQIKIKRNQFSRVVWRGWILPFVIIWIYSMGIQILGRYSTDYLVHTSTLCVRMILYMLFAVESVRLYGKRTADLLLYACMVAYVPAVIKFFYRYGFIYGTAILFSKAAYVESLALEVHTLTYIFGFITVYYFYQAIYYKKACWWRVIISCALTILGLKRIVDMALAATLLVIMAFLLIKPRHRYRVTRIACVSMTILAFVYLYAIQSGVLEHIMRELHINDSFRFNFWNYFVSKYELSPAFMGYGISYSHRVMQHEWGQIQYLRTAVNIHNDVLGYYLGLGFLGSLLFWGMFFWGRVKLAGSYISVKAATFSFVLSFYYFVVMMTSNEGLNEFPHSIYFMLVYVCMYFDADTRREKIPGGRECDGITTKRV